MHIVFHIVFLKQTLSPQWTEAATLMLSIGAAEEIDLPF
jgi:hypothetical protein